MDIDLVATEQQQTVDIAPDGDLIFLVGSENIRIRVHSLIVKNASKVFASLLGPCFSEGQTLSANTNSGQVAEVFLPDDDPEAMSIIFKVIHGRNDMIPEPPNHLDILKVAIAVDKWDCRTPLNWAIVAWLKCEDVRDVQILWALTLAAYWFRDEKGFKDATSALVLNHAESYLELGRNVNSWFSESQDVLMTLRFLLEQSRANRRTAILHAITQIARSAPHCGCSRRDQYCSRFLNAWDESLCHLKLTEISLATVLNAVLTLGDLTGKVEDANSVCRNKYRHDEHNVKPKLTELVHKVKTDVGISLQELRDVKSSFQQ